MYIYTLDLCVCVCAHACALPTVPDARCEMRERYCRMVHRVSTSMLILLRYMRMRGMRPGNPSWEGEGRTWCNVYKLCECLSLGERMVKVCTICVSYVFMYAVKCVMICVKCSA